ncbi:MAG TPA: type IV pilus secretin PilQ [Candidatus Angelobacter sp.]
MRLRQLLGIIVLAMGTIATATASVSELSGVQVKSWENAGVVTILASGTMNHTEYRPAENLLLVDLAGVAVPHPDPTVHTVFVPGVRSYRIFGYRSAGGAETARIEINLVPGAKVDVSDITGGVEVRVSGAPVPVASKEQLAAITETISGSGPVSHIRDISVLHDPQGLSVQITGNGPLTAKTMKLKGPDRLVVDIPNSVLEGRPREIAVNGKEVRAVRAARYQDAPPVTRVVVDLAGMREFDVVPAGNKLLVKLRGTPAATPADEKALTATTVPGANISPAASSASASTTQSAAASPAPVPSTGAAMAPVKSEEKEVTPAQVRADAAASHFNSGVQNVASTNQPPFPVNASLAARPAVINAALQQQSQTGATVALANPGSTSCTSGRYTGEPISVNFPNLDLKEFFRVIQEVSGLNVVLDPAVKGSVSIYLNDVPWDQVLAIVLNNNGLECQLQGNVLRIVTLETLKNEAEARAAQQTAQALAVPKKTITRYLSYGQSKDAVIIVKKFLSPRGDVVADPRTNSLIIEDIPSTLPKIEDLLNNIDRKTPQVEIEARVVASTRSFTRDIGTQLGVSFAGGNNAVGGATTNSPISVTLPTGPPHYITGTGSTTTIPLFSNLAANATSGLEFSNATANFRLDFILTLAETRGLVKVLSRPSLTTQNNVAATIKQGAQIPVVTAAQLGGPPTVQYIQAFLRLTVTPQITAENTIFLNLDVENTTADFSRVTGAQLNPALDTQQATTSVLVKDGGTVVIGGVIQTQNNLAIAQVPLLGSIPLLGNLFKHTSINTQTQELIFFITPKIIES